MSEELESHLAEKHEVTLKTGSEVEISELSDFDFTFLGASTWWDWDVQEEMQDLVESLKSASLAGKKIAVFGNGMSSFPQFCKAADEIAEAVKSSGAELSGEVFKVDWDVYDAMDDLKVWANKQIS